MAVRGSYSAYRRRLVTRARELRREPTPAETKLWFDFLRRCPAKFSRQKPLGHYIRNAGAKHDASRDASLRQLGFRILRFTNEDVVQRFEGVCLEIAAVLEEPKT